MIIKLINKLRMLQNVLYSFVIKSGLRKAGANFFIEYPSRIIGGKYITIGKDFYCFGRLRLDAYDKHNNYSYTPDILIGYNVSLNFDCHIACVNRIEIGDNVLIASKVFITDHSHGNIDAEALKLPPSSRRVISKGPVIIKNNVWIGEGAVILPGVTLEENCIVGANAVVTKSFPANSIIGGNPAKLIKTLI